MFRLRSIILYGTALLLAACQSDEWDGGRTGGIRVALAETTVNVETKATPAEIVTELGGDEKLKSQFDLRIVNTETDQVAYSGKYTDQTINVAPGTYQVIASYGDNAVLAWDKPYFFGKSTEVTVEEDATEAAQATVECKVANSFLEMRFNPTEKGESDPTVFDNLFNEYGIDITGGGSTYHFTSTEQKNGRNPYFQAESNLTFTFVGKLKAGGEIKQPINSDELKTIEGGKKYIVNLKMSSISGGSMDITVDKQETTIKENIPLEWLPKPKVESKGFNENNTLTFVETEQPAASISLNTATELQDIKFKFNFEDEQYASLNKENKEYLLSNAEDKAAIETALGITLPAVGTKDAKIDLAALVAKMQTKAGVTTTNTIELDVQANNRWSSENTEANRVYTLVCEKPEFTINVDEKNVWSREFTIDEATVTKGNADKIKEKLKYQYSADDGTTWIECKSRDQVAGRIQQFQETADKITQKEYKVRAFYRDAIASADVKVTLENPEQLPNSNMEEWSIETKKKSGGWPFADKTYYTFHPYAEGSANSSWWATNNDKAQGGTYALGIWYEGCFASCVSYTEDSHEGSKAALMYLSGCGDGYANTAGTYVGGAMVGSLFIGSYNSGIVQGHNFDSRPTSLTFWYKYKPYKSDAFKVLVSLKNGDKEIASGTYTPNASSTEDNSYNQATIALEYKENSEKATTICVQFLASDKTELSRDDFAWGTTINYPVVGNWTVHMGSILKIDDISLIYDK